MKRSEKIREFFAFKPDQASDDEIRIRMEEGSEVRGTNMYILILAILIASAGLNVNSTAVVIGAMLISPLMGGILSIAYGMVQQDFRWVRVHAARFLFQIAVSIITSTIYFLLSPMESFSGELAARTHPTIWDVLIALCGGFAAIIANTRKNTVSNVIPGAAIATALMPPLCTVGYCLSSAKWIYALGAFYLFLINAIFIFISAVIGLQMMGVTKTAHLIRTKKDKIFITVFLVLVIIPSGLLAWQTVFQSSQEENCRIFLEEEFNFENTQIVRSDIDVTGHRIDVALIGSILSEDEIQEIKDNMAEYDLNGYTLDVIQMPAAQGITKEQIEAILKEKELSS